nr:DALR anticodon-binding domain-containing protein [Argonema antarcticum]
MVKVVAPGLIHFQLSDLGISAWLQRLVGHGKSKVKSLPCPPCPPCPPPLPHSPTPPLPHSPTPPLSTQHSALSTQYSALKESQLFAVQYAHARCCSLLRLAHREGAIALVEPDRDTSPARWSLVSPNPIPWLTSDKKLRLVHPAERALISHLFALQDNIYCPYPSGREINWEKTALTLSDLFETFYRRCRIWGEVKKEDLCLAQARLGLLVVTQTLLRLVLQDFLGVFAPLEL